MAKVDVLEKSCYNRSRESIKRAIGMSMFPESKDEDREVIRFCKNCFGKEPCLCDKHDYVKTWEFLYWVFKNCKM